MTDQTGKSIGRYHLLEKLGQGGMAIVYKAYDTRLEREVAIKVIRKEAFPPEQLDRVLKRFEREAKSLAKLSHAHIVNVHDFGEHDGSPYLVMEYLPGGTLKAHTGQPLPFPEAAQILEPIARALAYAHEEGILHRDIKPANILITRAGEPVLTDFGIAKLLESDQEQTLTGTGVGVGTPEYMSPEQGFGKEVDGRADVYGLGVVLYELLTGRKPYTADTPFAVLLKQVNDPLPDPREIIPDLPVEVEYILIKALAKKPEDRYQTMKEFARALEKVCTGKSAQQDTPAFAPRQTQENPSPDPDLETVDQLQTMDTPLQKNGFIQGKPKPVMWWKWALGGLITLAAGSVLYLVLVLPGLGGGETSVPAAENPTPENILQPTNIESESTAVSSPSDPTVLFYEDFEDGKTQGFTYIAGGWNIVEDETGNHVYELDNSNGNDFPGFYFGTSQWRDYSIEFRMQILNPGKGWTIIYFRQNESDQYVVSIDTQTTSLDFTEDYDGWKPLTARENPLEKNTWYDVRIEADGEDIRVYIDDRLIINTDDPRYQTGNVEIQVGQYSYIQLDDIIVRDLQP